MAGALAAAVVAWWIAGVRPAVASLHEEQARDLLLDGQPTEAVAVFSQAIRWQPDNADLYEGRGLARARSGDPAALDDLERALARNPQSARLHEALARYEEARGRRERAIGLQRQAVALHPLDAGHRLTLAEMLWEDGSAQEAREQAGIIGGLLLQNRDEDARYRSLLALIGTG